MKNKNVEIIKLDASKFGVEKSRAKEMESAFIPMIIWLKEKENEFNEIVKKSKNGIDAVVCSEAKRLRLQYVKSRTSVDDVHKTGKQEVLLLGRAWDGLKNQYLYITNQKEEDLQKIEKHFEILEQEKKTKLKAERETALAPFQIETEFIQLGEMSEQVWNNYFQGVKLQHENKIAAEAKAETDRIAAEEAGAAERERIRIENENLRKENETKEKQLAEERKASEAKAKKVQKDAEAKLKTEKDAKAKLERELKTKTDAEAKQKADAEARAEAELNKGDTDKVKDLITDLTALKTKYIFKSKKNKKMYENVGVLLEKITTFINLKN